MLKRDVERLVGELEAEINNGGFDQFFFNSAGDDASEIIKALVAIGASKTASIVRSACAKFPGGMPPSDRNQRQAVLLESVSPESDAFESETEQFLEYEENLERLVAAYSPA